MMSQKEELYADWHPEDIKAKVHKLGLSFSELSRRNGYAAGSLKTVLRAPCKPYQQIVADALGVPPEIIWPSRYRAESYMRKEF